MPRAARLEERRLLSGGATVNLSQVGQIAPLALGTTIAGTITSGAPLFYQIAPNVAGLLVARVQGHGLPIGLTLLDNQGDILVQSQGQSLAVPDGQISQHVVAGTDILEVASLAGAGSFTLTTSLTASSNPFQPVAVNFADSAAAFALGDLNGDGIPDLVAPDGIHFGLGDGTFEPAAPGGALAAPGNNPSAIVIGDFNGDGKPDVAIADSGSNKVVIFLGSGNGTLATQAPITIKLPTGSAPSALVAGDFTGNGRLDLAVANQGTNCVTILVNNGDGTFTPLAPIKVGTHPVALVAGDFTGDGNLDLAVADSGSNDVRVLINNGYGTFTQLTPIKVGTLPDALAAGDFNNDGHLDLAVADGTSNDVRVLMGLGNGTFTQLTPVAVGTHPDAIVAADLNGDGNLDLAVADANSNDVTVLPGNGDGSFQNPVFAAAGSFPRTLAVADLNGDGRLDLVTGNSGQTTSTPMTLSVLLGNGDGTFQDQASATVGAGPVAVVSGDFTNNDRTDLAVADGGTNAISLLLGNGDGTFQPAIELPVGKDPVALVAGDFNDDGRLDLAVANEGAGSVTILLGNGDGTFRTLAPIKVGSLPDAIALGDFSGNGRLGLAVAEAGANDVRIFSGNGDGTFTLYQTIALPTGSDPTALVSGDLSGDGLTDLAVADTGTDAVTILLARSNGTFDVLPSIPLNQGAFRTLSLVAGNFQQGGPLDLAVAAGGLLATQNGTVSVLLGNGDGTFQVPVVYGLGVGVNPAAIVTGDFGGNGLTDLATANFNSLGTDDYSVLLGNGDGTFQAPTAHALGGTGNVTALAAGDLNGDGRDDLGVTLKNPGDVIAQLSLGAGQFASPGAVALSPQNTPLLADLNGDSVIDVTIVDTAGEILYRQGRPTEPGSFDPPVVVNPGDPARAIAFVNTDLGPLLASVDENDDAVSLFRDTPSGFVLVGTLATGALPAQIVAADLTGTGATDLIVRNAGDGTLSIFYSNREGPNSGQGPPAPFLSAVSVPVGPGVTNLTVADVNGDGASDLVLTDGPSGTVSVLENTGHGFFAAPTVLTAGTGPYLAGAANNPTTTHSLEATAGSALGTLTAGAPATLVTDDPGSNSLGILVGLGGGRFANPYQYFTSSPAIAVRLADLTGNGLSDLIYLTSSGLFVALANGHGGFDPPTEYDAGLDPTGLGVGDVNGDRIPDLLVGNLFGDVLVLLGNGDGTFQPPRPTNQQVSFAVADLTGNGQDDFVFSSQSRNQVSVQYGGTQTTILADLASGLINPGQVQLADLNGNGILDLIVLDSGSNNVLIYPGLGNGQFGPELNGGHGFFTGDNPVGLTVADVNGDGRPDLIIADQGSNDVTILFNAKVGGGFTFTPGPRLQAGVGPVSTALVNPPTGGPPDLLVSDSGANEVLMLKGLGGGFFDDQSPTVFPVGVNPGALFVGPFTGPGSLDFATLNQGSNSVTLISGFTGTSPVAQTISSGGQGPIAGIAGDISGNGYQDLLVANNGNGVFSLLAGGPGGLSLASTTTAPGLPNPSALALSTFSGDDVDFYAANEGSSSATLLSLGLNEENSGPSPSESAVAVASAPGAGTAQLIPLTETSLALVGTLLPMTLEFNSENVEVAGAAAAGQSVPGQFNDLEGEAVAGQDVTVAQAIVGAVAKQAATWARYVFGLDEAIDQIRSQSQTLDALFEEPSQKSGTGPQELPASDAVEEPSAFLAPALLDEALASVWPSSEGPSEHTDRALPTIDAPRPELIGAWWLIAPILGENAPPPEEDGRARPSRRPISR